MLKKKILEKRWFVSDIDERFEREGGILFLSWHIFSLQGIQNLSHYASNSSTVPSSLQVKEGDARIFEQKFEENESKRRERELVMKNELGAIKLAITGPKNVKHKLHVDNQLNWTGDDSLSRSIELSTKLGEG